jgi:hypothetical protein
MRKLSIANVIGAYNKPKLRTATIDKIFQIVPLKAVTPQSLPPQTKIRPTPCPGQSKIVSAEGRGGNNTGYFCAFFLHLAPPIS